MCGIFGLISKSTVSNRSVLSSSRETMIHRGPDDFGEWWSENGCIGLGHRRLSIVDLSKAGHQPMVSSNGELVIVFNGEIYNHKEIKENLIKLGHNFRSTSDTEVLLISYRQWGLDCLDHLNGMFAFAIYDSQENRIFLARDRAGEKPLFYHVSDDLFLFGSELKALLKFPNIQKKINLNSLDSFLSNGYVQGNESIVQGIKKLPPAHAVVFKLSNREIKVWRYWDLPDWEESKSTESELLEELEYLLEDSVSKQLEADVPVGVLLSGGVDSSLVTALAVRNNSRVKTFTIGFPGYAAYDESKHAKLIANYFGTEHFELVAEESTADLLFLLAKQFDEPIIDSSMIPTYLVSKLIRQHCTVALGGDGGDELFGGYGHHSRLLWLKSRFSWISQKYFRNPISRISESILPIGFKGRNWLQGLGTDFDKGLPQIASYFDQSSRLKLMNKKYTLPLNSERNRAERIPKNLDILQRATRMDFENYLPEDILVKVDRASMLNSLEVRAPLLDHRIIEFAFKKVPSYLKANLTGEKKILLKKLCGKILPAEFDKTRKQGFSIPLSAWLQKGNWKDCVYDVLLSKDQKIFDEKYLKNLLNGQTKGRNNSERIFALTLFELWRKEYDIQF